MWYNPVSRFRQRFTAARVRHREKGAMLGGGGGGAGGRSPPAQIAAIAASVSGTGGVFRGAVRCMVFRIDGASPVAPTRQSLPVEASEAVRPRMSPSPLSSSIFVRKLVGSSLAVHDDTGQVRGEGGGNGNMEMETEM